MQVDIFQLDVGQGGLMDELDFPLPDSGPRRIEQAQQLQVYRFPAGSRFNERLFLCRHFSLDGGQLSPGQSADMRVSRRACRSRARLTSIPYPFSSAWLTVMPRRVEKKRSS